MSSASLDWASLRWVARRTRSRPLGIFMPGTTSSSLWVSFGDPIAMNTVQHTALPPLMIRQSDREQSALAAPDPKRSPPEGRVAIQREKDIPIVNGRTSRVGR